MQTCWVFTWAHLLLPCILTTLAKYWLERGGVGRRGGSSQGRFPTPPTPLLLVCWQAQGWRRGGDATEPWPLRGRRGLRLSRAPFGTLLHGTRAACAFRMGSTWLPFLSLETRAPGRGHPPVRDVHSSADPRGRVEREVARVPSGARWHGGAQRAPWAFARPLAAPRAHVPSALPTARCPRAAKPRPQKSFTDWCAVALFKMPWDQVAVLSVSLSLWESTRKCHVPSTALATSVLCQACSEDELWSLLSLSLFASNPRGKRLLDLTEHGH